MPALLLNNPLARLLRTDISLRPDQRRLGRDVALEDRVRNPMFQARAVQAQ